MIVRNMYFVCFFSFLDTLLKVRGHRFLIIAFLLERRYRKEGLFPLTSPYVIPMDIFKRVGPNAKKKKLACSNGHGT